MTDEERAHEIAILAVGYIDGDLYGLVMRKVLDALATARARTAFRIATAIRTGDAP